MRTRAVLLVGLALALALFSAWTVSAQSPSASPAAVPPITIRMPLAATITLDPAYLTFYQGTPDEFVARQLFAGLTRPTAPGQTEGDLASSWTSSPDSSVFTFTLRGGLLWSDGTPITAVDVRYSITRALSLDPLGNLTYSIQNVLAGAEAYATGVNTDSLSVGISPVDSTTVVFTLTKSAAYFPSVLAIPPAYLVPRQAIFDHGAAWTDVGNIVVAGPYVLMESNPGVRKVLTKNPLYWDAANATIERVELPETGDSLGWAQYTLGLVDTMLVPTTTWQAAVNDPLLGPELYTSPRRLTQQVGIGATRAPFDNLLVRQAFAATIDRQTLADVVLSGTVGSPFLPAGPFMAPGIWGHDEAVSAGVGWPYSPTLGQGLLARAGYTNGVGLPPVTMWFENRLPYFEVGDALRSNWYNVLGVSVTLQYTDNNGMRSVLRGGAPQLWRRGWLADYADGFDFLGETKGTLGFPETTGGWHNITYTTILSQAALTTNDAARAALYAEADRIMVMTDTALAPMYYGASGIGAKPYLQRTYDDGGSGARIAEWRVLPAMSLSPIRANGLVGVPMTVTVAITNAPTTGAFAFTLVYNPSQVTVQALTLGPFLGSTGRAPIVMVNTISNTAGTATFVVNTTSPTPPGPSGGGALAYIRLTPQVAGAALLRLTSTELGTVAGAPIDHAAQNGLVNTPACPGDLNGSGSVTIGDIQLPAYAYGSHPGESRYNVLYDLDNNGAINLLDLQRVAYRWGTACSVGQEAQGPGTMPQLTQPVTLTLQQSPGWPASGETFTASVVVSNVADLGAFQFSLGYLTGTVRVAGVALAEFPGSTGRSFAAIGPSIDNVSGTATFGAYSTADPADMPGPSGNGALAVVTFLAIQPGQTTVQFSGVEVDNPQGEPQTPWTAPDGSLVIGYKAFLPVALRAYP